MEHRSFLGWILNRFTALQIYTILSLIVTISTFPLAYLWIINHLARTHVLDLQIESIEYEDSLKSLFNRLQKHRLMSQRFLSGYPEFKVDLENLDRQVEEALQQVKNSETSLQSQLVPSGYFIPFFDAKQFETNWQTLSQRAPDLTIEKSNQLHNFLIHLIRTHFTSNRTHLFDVPLSQYIIIENVLSRLPILQDNVDKFALLAENAVELKSLTPERVIYIRDIAVLIQANLTYIKNLIDHESSLDSPNNRFLEKIKKEMDPQTRSMITDYYKSVENLVNTVQTRLLNSPTPAINLSQLTTQSDEVLEEGSKLWDRGLDILKENFAQERDLFFLQMWGILLLTYSLMGICFFIGLAVTLNKTRRFNHITKSMDSFAKGDLSIRIPIHYEDQVDHLGVSFNQMANKLEETINTFYELLEATNSLAKGQLFTRISLKPSNEEFKEDVIAFNKMAENLENIIRRLERLGITLTTSATEIAGASKEQEKNIIEQEATTREITVAANEISSTAKEFANTMNEVSQAAEHTAGLAVKGKESLINMETIMKQMVEASTNIASKLAVLNEKAGNITTVITTITKVADQTNLLSLNASIEAEKAGEYGKSFAVIAREIRRLADQTALSTLDIEKIVNEMMTAVSSSVMGVDDFTQEIKNGVEEVKKVTEQLALIIEQVETFATRFELVNQGMQAQLAGASQINESLAQLSQTAQQTTESIHQFHRTIQELNSAANELRTLTPFIQENMHAEEDNVMSPKMAFADSIYSSESGYPKKKGLSELSTRKPTL